MQIHTHNGHKKQQHTKDYLINVSVRSRVSRKQIKNDAETSSFRGVICSSAFQYVHFWAKRNNLPILARFIFAPIIFYIGQRNILLHVEYHALTIFHPHSHFLCPPILTGRNVEQAQMHDSYILFHHQKG